MSDKNNSLHLAKLLASRLERLSADSVWAHWASGVRGSLLRHIERLEAGNPTDKTDMQNLLQAGFEILEQAAGEKRPDCNEYTSQFKWEKDSNF